MALLFEQTHQKQKFADVSERLRLYDTEGTRIGKLTEPAKIDISVDPPGTEIEISRYSLDKKQKFHLVDTHQLGTTPLSNQTLPPASYLLTFRTHGYEEIRYPLLVSHGEHLKIAFRIPKAGTIPAGYVYIPPGRFLFGSAAAEIIRAGTLTTVPLHQVQTNGYLISKTEMTLASFLEFAKTTSAEEKALLPILSVPTNSVYLKELTNQIWSLRIQHASETTESQPDGTFIYKHRKKRAIQQWMKLPLSGINSSDAQKFLLWLDKSSRVPGARFCTELEWERAARGADDRDFPHGNRVDPDEANFDETYGQDGKTAGPDEVGTFPMTESPFGILDMSSNVFEWTRSSISRDSIIMRSGAFWQPKFTANVANRSAIDQNFRDSMFGLRTCASYEPSR